MSNTNNRKKRTSDPLPYVPARPGIQPRTPTPEDFKRKESIADLFSKDEGSYMFWIPPLPEEHQERLRTRWLQILNFNENEDNNPARQNPEGF